MVNLLQIQICLFYLNDIDIKIFSYDGQSTFHNMKLEAYSLTLYFIIRASLKMSKYAQRMAHLSARIFGEYTRERTYTANRIINEFKSLPKYKDPQVVKYYPKHVEASMLLLRLREHGLYRYLPHPENGVRFYLRCPTLVHTGKCITV